MTGTLEEERLRARRLQNERDVQQATAMSHKEKERHLQSELDNEKKKRAQVEQKLENEREKYSSLNRDLTARDSKIDELQKDLEAQVLRESDKVSFDKSYVRVDSPFFYLCEIVQIQIPHCRNTRYNGYKLWPE